MSVRASKQTSLVFIVVLIGITSCRRADTTRVAYSVQGTVEAISADRREVTIHHETIPGYMNSMTMPFPVTNPHLLDGITVHEPVLFELLVTPKEAKIDAMMGESDAKTPVSPDASPKPPDNAAFVHVPKIGEEIPDIVLTNQEGQRVRLRNERGKVLVLNFIFTRCPLPNYCPHSMETFAEIRKKMRLWSRHDVMLLTATFDPTHDTPERMAAYGQTYGADPAYWQMLTGRPDEVTRAVSFFDINYWMDKGTVQEHTLSTVLINPQGRIAQFYTGPDVRSDQLITDIQTLLSK